ncbi:MAG: hypothetical protein R3A48_04530 [Polyangiales bacterium]
MAILLLFMPLLFVGMPAALWFRSRDEARRRWLPRQEGTTRLGDDNYRGAEVPRLVADGPPRLVHVTAVMCWVLGAAIVPGGLMSLLGLLVMGVGAVGIPGLIAAARLLRLGGPLLRGEPEAAERARSAARFIEVLNAVVLLVTGVFSGVAAWRFLQSGHITGDAQGVVAMAAFTALYAVVSLVHARMLRRCAALIDAEQVRRAEQGGVRIEVAAPAHAPAPVYAEAFAPPAATRRQGE